MSAVEAVEAGGCDDTQGCQETHPNEEGEGDKSQHWPDDGAVLRHLAPYNNKNPASISHILDCRLPTNNYCFASKIKDELN